MEHTLQVALDMPSLVEALQVTQQVASHVDVIELGTALVLEEGLKAVRIMRALYPSATLLADIRIIKAGKKLATAAFLAGASRVTVMSAATQETLEAVVKAASDFPGCEVQVEITDGYDETMLTRLKKLGLKHLIYHRSSEVLTKESPWSDIVLRELCELAERGFLVSVTGGLGLEELDRFKEVPVHCFIVGRDICGASDPGATAQAYKAALAQL